MSEFVNGDCMSFLPSFPDGAFDLAIVDPPYGSGASDDAAAPIRGGGRFDRYKRGIEARRDMGDEIPDERGFL